MLARVLFTFGLAGLHVASVLSTCWLGSLTFRLGLLYLFACALFNVGLDGLRVAKVLFTFGLAGLHVASALSTFGLVALQLAWFLFTFGECLVYLWGWLAYMC